MQRIISRNIFLLQFAKSTKSAAYSNCIVRLLNTESANTDSSKPENKLRGNNSLEPQKKMYNSNGQRFGGETNFYGGFNQNSRFNGGYGGSAYGHRNSFGGDKLRDVDYSKVETEPAVLEIYNECQAVSQRSDSEIKDWLTKNEVALHGSNIPRPVFQFNEVGFLPELEKLLYNTYEAPTSIQAISWPGALSGRNLISIARTGSGKTIGFILPGIMHTKSQPKRKPGSHPTVLVLLPTRELAQQVYEVSKPFCNATGLTLTCLYGGSSKGPQESALSRGVDICIATPGRLLDFLQTGVTNLRQCTYLVLDEADRMLDMGFEPQIRKIVGQMRSDRQTLMFSATWPTDVKQLALDFQPDPIFLNVGSMELSANPNITQYVEVIQESDKPRRLFDVLTEISNYEENKTLIFVETKRKANMLTESMRRDGWPALCIHGDKSQAERDWVMQQFKSGKAPIMLATDVAARGIDVHDISFVINYDFPNSSAEDYVHRIGRTGRSNRTGVSYTFFTSANAAKANELVKILQQTNQKIPQELENLCGGFSSSNSKSRYRSFNGSSYGNKSNGYSSSGYGSSGFGRSGSGYNGGSNNGYGRNNRYADDYNR